MPAYFVARLSVKDSISIAQYSKNAAPIIAKYEGKLLFKGGVDDNLAGSMNLPNIAVFEFPSKTNINEFFNSREYQALTPLREVAAEMVLSAHEGI